MNGSRYSARNSTRINTYCIIIIIIILIIIDAALSLWWARARAHTHESNISTFGSLQYFCWTLIINLIII